MLEPTWSPSSRQLRQFSVAALFGFGFAGAGIWRSTGSATAFAIACALGGAVCLAGLLVPEAVRPLYVALMAVTLPIGWLVSWLLLITLYFGLIMPVSWVFRLSGRDQLALKRRPRDESYWRPYKSAKDVGSYFRQA